MHVFNNNYSFQVETQPNHVIQGTLTKVKLVTSINVWSCNECMSLLWICMNTAG